MKMYILIFSIVFMAVLSSRTAIAGGEISSLVPILGTSIADQSIGVVAYVVVELTKRDDDMGIIIQFPRRPEYGTFSPPTETAIVYAIGRATKIICTKRDSWTVQIFFPYKGNTVYGNSLSAMVALSIIALVEGEIVPHDRVMTGTILSDGSIGGVGAVSKKVEAAHRAHFNRVLVPDERDPSDSDWKTPFLMRVSPVLTVQEAYTKLIRE